MEDRCLAWKPGKVSRVDEYIERDNALEAAGLSE
jgi:hypothetical protein